MIGTDVMLFRVDIYIVMFIRLGSDIHSIGFLWEKWVPYKRFVLYTELLLTLHFFLLLGRNFRLEVGKLRRGGRFGRGEASEERVWPQRGVREQCHWHRRATLRTELKVLEA